MAGDAKGVAIILGKLAKKKGDEGDSQDDSGGDEYSTAAEEVMNAIEAKDPDAFAEAMKSFVHMCQAEG